MSDGAVWRQDGVVETLGDFSLIIANRSGGQGKTTLTQAVKLALNFAGIKPKLVSIDSGGAGSDVSTSKLGSIEEDVLDLRFAADLDEQMRDPNIAAGLFDPLMEVLMEHDNVLVDLGANTIDALFAWAENRGIDGLLTDRKLGLLVPTTIDNKALDEALKVLKRAEKGSIPIRKSAVAVIETRGRFDEANSVEKRALADYCAAHGIPVFGVPVNTYLEFSEKFKVRYLDFWNMTVFGYQEYVSQTGVGQILVGRASSTVLTFGKWMKSIVNSLVDADLLPKIQIPEKPFGKSPVPKKVVV